MTQGVAKLYENSIRELAPMPSPEEQARIDWFGIYGERTDPPYAYWRCEKQALYVTAKEARVALNLIMRKRAIRGPIEQLEVRHYWCRQHGGFHLTSKGWNAR